MENEGQLKIPSPVAERERMGWIEETRSELFEIPCALKHASSCTAAAHNRQPSRELKFPFAALAELLSGLSIPCHVIAAGATAADQHCACCLLGPALFLPLKIEQ